jgi:hypothetical protein
MPTRTVHLDDEAEAILARLRQLTGSSISELLKRGSTAYEVQALAEAFRRPYDIYRELDLGRGGEATAPARDAKTAVADAIRNKHRR